MLARFEHIRLGAAVFMAVQLFVTSIPSAQVTDNALDMLHERITANRTRFLVYDDADSGFNHGFASGFFGRVGKVTVEAACVFDEAAPDGCSSDSTRLDAQRGNVLQVAIQPLASGEFAGLNIEEPEHWGVSRLGRGFDLTGAAEVVFEVMTPTPGFRAQFGLHERVSAFLDIPATWTEVRIPFSSLGLGPAELTDVHVLFTVVTNDLNARTGGVVLLNDIRFEPLPTAQTSAVGFPLANQTFGIVPVVEAVGGRVPIPPDQVLRNVTTTYESALAIFALLDRATPQDIADACQIADAFAYAIAHDNQGLPLPVAPGGARGLRNAYESGDLALFNSQGPDQGQQGEIRLAGFSAGPALCGPSGFCLVLDGATGGNVSFAIKALLEASTPCVDTSLKNMAEELGTWIVELLRDTDPNGYGGYFLGYPDGGEPDKANKLIRGKSIENNADIFAAFSALAAAADDPSEAAMWTVLGQEAGSFVLEMFDDSTGCFFAGTVLAGQEPGPGITPSTDPSQQRGNDVVNLFRFLDANTFAVLAMAQSVTYGGAIDWRRPVRCARDRFKRNVTVAGQPFQGFSIDEVTAEGPDGVAWEFTAQVVAAMRLVDTLYSQQEFSSDIALYVTEIARAQNLAPFADGRGLVASTLQGGVTLPPREQCLTTPFQCIAERVGLAATAWAIYADRNINPFGPTCGNGSLDAGEECDDGASNGRFPSCCTTTCSCAVGTSCSEPLCQSILTCTDAAGSCECVLLP